MYQALYRKWRPRTFADVIGQSHITDTLQKQVAEGRTSHAYLFTGTRGTGKTTCAKILAKAVNCEHPVNGDPCCKCPSCLGIESGTLLDVLELDAASNNGVDQVRALRDEAVYAPANVKMRVYIVDEVHMLSIAAFNALLKILEEPPAHLMFILATTELHKVPATILSRCQRFSFKRIQPRDIQSRLSHVAFQEGIDLKADGAELLSRLSDGALRDALSLLDQCAASGGTIDAAAVLDTLGLAGNLQTARMMEHILNRDVQYALLLLDQLYAGGKEVGAILSELSTLTRDLLLRRTAPEGGAALLSGGYDAATLDRLGKDVSYNRFLYLTATLQKTAADLYFSANRRTDAELCLLRLCDESLSGDLTALSARIQRLEEGAARGSVIRTAVEESAPQRSAPQKRSESRPQPKNDPDLWDRPPLPAEPPMMDEPGERFFDIPEEPPVTSAPRREMPPVKETAVRSDLQEAERPAFRPAMAAVPSVPAQSASAPEGTGLTGNWWRALAESCKGRLSPMYRVFLDKCAGALEGEQVIVFAPDEITLSRIDNDRVRGILSEEVARAAGHPMPLHLRVGEPPKKDPKENLQNLLAFASKHENIEIK